MGIKTRQELQINLNNMKFSPALLFAVAAADDKKVPPRHPLQRLARLTEFTEEILNAWFSGLASKDAWVNKFANNAARMEANFNRGEQRCGHYDENQQHGGPERKRREAADHWLQQVGPALRVAMLRPTSIPIPGQPHDQVEQPSPGTLVQPGVNYAF